MGNQATLVSRLEKQSGKLPSQPEANRRENVSAMTLRSDKELPSPIGVPSGEDFMSIKPVTSKIPPSPLKKALGFMS